MDKPEYMRLLGFMILGTFISTLIFGLAINPIILNSCDYHEPINKEPSVIFNTFYSLEGGMHLAPNNFNLVLWVITGALLGSLIFVLIEKLKKRNITKNCGKKTRVLYLLMLFLF